jgi:hypothetical protein
VSTPAVAVKQPSQGRSPGRAIAAERPYVRDVGEAKPLSRERFERIIAADAAVRATVARIGMPSYAELQQIEVDDPWVGYELRVYYLDYGKMLVFGRAMILGDPRISLLRHSGAIPPGKLVTLTARCRAARSSLAWR